MGALKAELIYFTIAVIALFFVVYSCLGNYRSPQALYGGGGAIASATPQWKFN